MSIQNKGIRLVGILGLIIGLNTELVYESTLNTKLSGELYSYYNLTHRYYPL